ncbi:hypothetical protein [Pseudoduganella violacea]|uniref:Uncharacterized protein n=1 Tax=Pseudoduganella violacea TaxID=1715466 RepID=A0A7W5FWM9_9BURK|nr:hypothetical protein [Pseudoduganella violacea]MBB3122195.1 hypothetical protein [Pseudoduganella violacea]
MALRPSRCYQQVQNQDELDYLIKESELLTGGPGRKFHLRSQERQVTIALEWDGYLIGNLNRGDPIKRFYLPRRLLPLAMLGYVLRSGMLFTRRLAE